MKIRIREAIKEQGFTLKDVATKIGTSPQSLHGIIEAGNPTISTLENIANVIGVPINTLYSEQSGAELTALIYSAGKHYRATTLDELEQVVCDIKAAIEQFE